MDIIWEQLQSLLLYLERPAVHFQLGGILIVSVITWAVSTISWRVSRRHYHNWVEQWPSESLQRLGRSLATIIEQIAFPILGLLLLPQAIKLFHAQGILTTLISKAIFFFWAILLYRLVVTLLYIFIGKQQVRPYHRKLLAPLFWLIFTVTIINILLNLRALGEIKLLVLFDDPFTLTELFGVVIALYFLVTVAWTAQDILQQFIAPHMHPDAGVLSATLTIGRYIVIAIGMIIISGALGFDPTSLAVIGGGLSIGVGFGLQTIISNFISGIVLLFEQSLRPGDVIEVEGVLGTVKELSIRSTTVRTFDNVEMIIPNETLFTSTVTTFTHDNRITRVLMTIGASYESDPKEVMEILLTAAAEHGLVLDDPEPAAFFEDYGSSSIDFHLAIWLDDPSQRKRVPSDLRLMIWKEFEKRGIEIPFPQRDLHIRSGLPAGDLPEGLTHKPVK